ncbi:MAG: nucleoside kinase [Thermotogaceae bacterium]|nr:nucleoside kinase [Thermotogaceae bacterium]
MVEVPKGSNLLQYAKEYQKYHDSEIVAAKLNSIIIELSRPLDRDGKVKFIDLSFPDGIRIYQRGLLFILQMAIEKLYPQYHLRVLHSLANSLYCELIDKESKIHIPAQEELDNIKDKMKEIVNRDLPIKKIVLYKDQARELFEKLGFVEKVKLLNFRKKKNIKVYTCDGHYNYFYGYMPPSTGKIKIFDLKLYEPGFRVLHPTTTSPNALPEYKELRKFNSVFLEYSRWLSIMDIDNVGDLNKIIAKGERAVADIILLAEALHEKRLSEISSEIKKRGSVRLILVAGPSSSGKTTFAKRLSIQLRVSGYRPVAISLDDYFVDREKTPRDENGNYDFEALEAIDVPLFNEHLLALFEGKEVEIPKYDFKHGRRIKGRKLKIDKDQIIIVEGIHGLNPKLTQQIPDELKFKLYVSALTHLNFDNMNRMSTTDTRLIRRMVRDYKFRGHSALDTLKMWPNVRKGEEKYIFPYQEEADVMFNSALVYELPVLKIFAESLLAQVPETEEEYSEALRLLKILDYFLPITNLEDIPMNSILREFIGRSIFKY